MPLKKGDKVIIYQDPYTQSNIEGEARLINKESTGPDGEERWFVQFTGEREPYLRTIAKPRDGKE
jgi:hypothetical protein